MWQVCPNPCDEVVEDFIDSDYLGRLEKYYTVKEVKEVEALSPETAQDH